MLDFRIQSFLAVCKYLSYTRAAQELGLTQPAITQHIQYLQESYQVKFFLRENNRLTLTPEGDLFRQTMITMSQDEKKLRSDLLNLNSEKFLIRFGTTRTFGEYELPSRLAAYLKSHPDREISMIIRNTHDLLHELDNGVLHFAIVDGYFSKSQYDFIPWSTEEFVCVCSSSHPLASRPEINFKDLLSEDLIIRPSGSGMRDIFLRLLEGHNTQLSDFKRVLEISDLWVIKQLVEEGLGITFLYRKAVAKELAGGTLTELHIRGHKTFHEFNFLWRKNSAYSNLFRLMYDLLHN